MWLETDALGLGGVCLGIAPIQQNRSPNRTALTNHGFIL